MPLTNKLINQIDRPSWEWLRFLPTASSATSCMCFGDNLKERYIYYLSGTLFYRYDTISDSYTLLQSPTTAVTSLCEMKYSSYSGYRGNILSATTNTFDLAGLSGRILKNKIIRITDGTGIGQERTITDISEPQILEYGVATTASVNNIGDSTKKWQINQFVGCQVRLIYSTGLTQVRKILYNDTNTLTVYDANYQQLECWNNVQFTTAPVTTAGSQTHFQIEKSTATIDTNWDVIPDSSSSYVVLTGGIWLISSASAAPWTTWQYYDRASDTWAPKTALCGLLLAALGTDVTIERTGEYAGSYLSSIATSATSRTLVDTTLNLEKDIFDNYQIRIISGTGIGQKRRITQNTNNTFWIEKPWDITPDTTSQYKIFGNTDRIYLLGNNQASVYKYSIDQDIWFQGNAIDGGITVNGSVKFKGQEPFGISSATRSTNGILTINTTPIAAGTGYVIGDTITLTTGSNGIVRVTGTTTSGAVTSVELWRCGSGYAATTTYSQSATSGTGTGCTIQVLTVGVIGTITTVTNTNLYKGDQITIGGASESAWNNNYTILGCFGLTTFDIAITATATFAAANSQSTTVLVDCTKNWVVNEHIGKIVMINTAGFNGTTQLRRITANTATTLTLQSAITAAVNGSSRYIFHQPQGFGRAQQYKSLDKLSYGYATSGTTTTLVDSTKNWFINQWVGCKFRINSGTGVGSEITITSNTTNTLNFTTQTFTPDATTDYLIMDTFGLLTAATNTTNATLTDTTKTWITNQWAGKRLRITSGTGQSQEITITSNTSTVITCSGVFTTAPSTDSTYTILESPIRGAGILCNWIFNSSILPKGKYLYVPRGGNNIPFDRYNITKELWEITLFTSPQSELNSTGSQYTYDGKDFIYYQPQSTGRIYRLNVNTLEIESVGQLPYAMSTATIGNRMEIIETVDNLKILYIARNTGQEFWRCLIYW